jgi:hypothetical protein
MISTLAYKNQLNSEKNAAMTRFSGSRGRVNTGFGGDLAGYNTNLIKSRAAQEDQLIQKKYDRGEISFDELLAHLTKAANREWLSPEEKQLMKGDITDLKVKYEDEQVAKEYNSGRMKAADVATYQRSKLNTMLPGTPAYENQYSEVFKWEKEDKINRAKEYVAREEARIAGQSDQPKAYSDQSSVYRQAANMFRAAGDTMTAYQYDEAANAADVNKQAYEVKSSKETAEQGKNDLVDRINLSYNQYHDGTITAQDFLASLDGYEREAITGKYTDLLDNMNKLTDYVREDVVYGKDWSRGGNRIKGPGVGTGGGSYDEFTGEWTGGGSSTGGTGTTGGSGTGYIGTGTSIGGGTGNVTKATTPQEEANKTPEQQNNEFMDGANYLIQKTINGEKSTEDFILGMQSLTEDRKTILENRLAKYQALGNTKVMWNGTKTSAKNVVKEINDELNNNWGKLLGMSTDEVGSAGINDMATQLTGNLEDVKKSLDLIINQPTQFGGDYTMKLSKSSPLSSTGQMPTGYIKDSQGRMLKMQSASKDEIISDAQWNILPPEQAALYDSNDGVTFVKKNAKTLYVDLPSAGGDSVRYLINDKGEVSGMPTPTIKDQTKYSQYLPEGMKLQDYIATPSAVTPLSQMINNATTSALLQKNKDIEAKRVAGLGATGQPLAPGQEQINNIAKVVGPLQPKDLGNTPMPVTAPKQFVDRVLNPLTPSKIVQPPQQPQIATKVVPSSFTGPLPTGTVSMADPLKNIKATQNALSYRPPVTPTPVQQPKPNIIQQATSWISNLFKPKKK